MSLTTYFKVAVFATIMCLVYIHMQMKIFELAYKGKDKERIIYQLADTNGVLTHQILTLKSANNLGSQLLDRENNLQFVGRDQMMMVVTPQIGKLERLPAPHVKVESPGWNIFAFLGIQEAKAWDKEN